LTSKEEKEKSKILKLLTPKEGEEGNQSFCFKSGGKRGDPKDLGGKGEGQLVPTERCKGGEMGAVIVRS